MNLQDHLKQHKLCSCEFAASRMEKNNWDGRMTAMQDEVLSGKVFWNTTKNLIIQGATSSGKTLLAEIAAYRQIADNEIWRKKVIFLVPLRALVTAQCKQIQDDFKKVELDGHALRIFESSADYQDHDAQIITGDYDIAVIVYEKFFALLNSEQRQDNRMLRNCGLVIVDELQMLSDKDRGPKMEFSIMRLLETCQQEDEEVQEGHIRIIGLTTSESGVEELGDWMKAEVVGNAVRPVPLRQHIISYNTGEMLHKDISGEARPSLSVNSNKGPNQNKVVDPSANSVQHGTADLSVDPAQHETADSSGESNPPKKIELIPRFSSGNRDEDKKRTCLYSLLATWIEQGDNRQSGKEQGNKKQGSGKKILIFANTKRRAHEIANEIVHKFPLLEPPTAIDAGERAKFANQLNNVLLEFSDEDGINDLTKLVPKGIAFHHSGLPAVVRTMIEDDFRDKNGHIQIIVCTETLMIGMNLPADVVILYDGTVYRGAGMPERISLQAYNNFVGRAGRLGMDLTPDYRGESYLLTERLAYDFNKYTANEKTAIRSPFRSDRPEELAPYFLNWIGAAPKADERIKKGLRINFCYHEKKENLSIIKHDAENILNQLKNAVPNSKKRLVRKVRNNDFRLSNFGNALAPYALSLDTCKTLIEYIDQNPINESDILFVAPDNEEKRFPPKALLELILTICSCSEVDKNPALSVFANERNTNEIKALNRALQSYLREIYPRQESKSSLQDEEENEEEYEEENAHKKLIRIAYSNYIAESEELRQIMRSLILCLWLAGYRVRKIKELLQLSNALISTSDIERISESAAYLIEAASKCQEILMDAGNTPALYWLSIRMKYGIPHELHSLANTHVREITRNQLLTIWRKAKHAHKTPRDYIMASHDVRYQALRKALREREKVKNYQQQIENIQEEDQSHICKELSPYLQNLDMHSGAGAQGCRIAISNILTTLSKKQETGWSISTAPEELIFTFYAADSRSYHLQLELFDMSGTNSDEWYGKICEFNDASLQDRNVHPVKIAVLYGTPPAGEEKLPPDLLVISSELLGVLLAKCIRDCTGSDMANLIYRILSDLKGRFILNGTSFFNTYGPISDLIKGYLHDKPDTAKPGLLYYSGIADPAIDSPCTVVPWGNTGRETSFKQIIAFYHPALLFSRIAEAHLKKCSAILCSEGDCETVKRDYGDERITTINTDINEMLEIVVKAFQQPARSVYEFDFGISVRGHYLDKMEKLKEELEKRSKRVLLMEKDDFSQRMAGSTLIEALYREFSQCRHVIICDTFDYDQSPYTAMVELNVVMDKIASALNKGWRYPIYRVRLPDVAPSHVLKCLLQDHYNVYHDDDVEGLAKELIGKSKYVDESNQSFL